MNFVPRLASCMLRGLFFRGRLASGMVLALSLMPITALAMEPVGVGNFHRVDARVYRGAQPTARGIQALADLGVHTVIDLREPGTRALWEKRLVEAAGMKYLNIPLSSMGAPPAEKVEEILAVFINPSSGPVFIHCRRGADRTGTLVACYRIAHDGWANRKALQEAHSFGMHWFEFSMKNYVLSYHAAGQEVTASSVPAAAGAVN